ncbi:2217_t:CDS:2, partial [Cetraspora pellucida]
MFLYTKNQTWFKENEQTNYRRSIYYPDDNKKITEYIQIILMPKQQKILFDKDQRSFLKEHEFVIGKDKSIVDKVSGEYLLESLYSGVKLANIKFKNDFLLCKFKICNKNTKELIISKSLILQLSEKYFDTYCNANHDYYIDEREIVYIVKKNDDKVLAIFLKCVLKKYLKDNKMKHRFNTCPCCGKLKFCYVEKMKSFGHENGYEQELYQETLNPCDVYNSPYTNYV